MFERMDGCLGECCIDYIRITTFFKMHSCFPFFLLHQETGLCTCSSNSIEYKSSHYPCPQEACSAMGDLC